MNKNHWQLSVVGMGLAILITASTAWAWQPKYASLTSDWAQLVDVNCPLPEYPRPQMVRNEWLNLNGLWQFQAAAASDPVPTRQTLAGEILVPYPMESALSGVAAYHDRAWYRRMFTVPTGWSGQRLLLHLDAVDWESEVFVNGQSVGVHRGGYDPATYDITAFLSGTGEQELIVRIYDPTDAAGEPRGKQTLTPGGIMYTSNSGIWQTVWLEPVPATHVASLKLVPDIDNSQLSVTVNVDGPVSGITVNAVARTGATVIGTISGQPNNPLLLPVPAARLWSPTQPFLYDLDITLTQGGVVVDGVTSYFGMRKISLGSTGGFVKMLLNNEFVFQFGPLDQGFWPDGIYTAPTDAALRSDIEQEKLFGYNMVRKHIKVESARWYYWADKLGILVWQDMPSANSYTGNPQPLDVPEFQTELGRLITNHWNSPAIIMWVLFNESQGQHDTAALVAQVKALDPSRLVNQASGGTNYGVGDVLDEHSYPNPVGPVSSTQAVVCGEFGGVGLGINNHTWAPGWGYTPAANGDDLAAQFEGFCYQLSDLVSNYGLCAAVYTELSDVEIELNGFLTYDRKIRKPDADRIRKAVLSVGTPIVLSTVLPTSQATGQAWLYTTSNPAVDWYSPGFNDSGWSAGIGGFGAGNPPNTNVRTAWATADIWLRRTFNPGALTAQQISDLVFSVYHDETVEIYLNGVLAASGSGYTTSYGMVPINSAGQAALQPNATNELAVHCHQTSGGQFVDVGIAVLQNYSNVAPRPLPTTPTGLRGVGASSGVTLGWDGSNAATTYLVKRSTVHGGPYSIIVARPALNSCSDPSVTAGNTYYYVVSAQNATGASSDSAELAITPLLASAAQPVAWFKASDLAGLADGSAVAIWSDASGHGNHATQAGASNRPSFASTAIHGRPAVRFNFTNSSFLAFARPVQDDFTIFCVFRSSQGIGTGTQFYQGAGLISGEMAGVVNDFGLSLNSSGQVLAGTGNPDVTAASRSTYFNDGQAHLVTFQRSRASGAFALFVDGHAQASASGGQQSLTAAAQWVLGAQQTLNNYLSGDIAEAIVFDVTFNESERVARESALISQYGLVGPGPVNVWNKWVGGNASGSWNTAANPPWSSGALPASADSADFSTLAVSADSIVTLDGNQRVNSLIFGSSTPMSPASWLLSPGSPSGSTLTLTGKTPTLAVNGISGRVSIGAVIAGNEGLTKTGGGTLALLAANTYSGATVIEGGTLQLLNTQPAGLVHRWSFNGSLDDAVGGRSAVLHGNTSVSASQVTINGGGTQHVSYVDLGSNILPAANTPVTIELWATQNQVQNWSRIFDFGSSQTNGLLMTWTRGTALTQDQVHFLDSQTQDLLQPYTLGTEFHLAMVLAPNGSGTTVNAYKMDSSGYVLASTTFTSSSNLTQLVQANMWLGRSEFADNDANASYNEVRIWNAALSPAQLAANSLAGPDTLSTPGSIGISSNLTLGAGATFDVSSLGVAANYSLRASLAASGTGTVVGLDAATLTGGASGTIDLGSQPLAFVWGGAAAGTDGSHPALVVSQGALTLGGNLVTVMVPGPPLRSGVYTLVITPSAISGSINPTPSFAGGNGLANGRSGIIAISGNRLLLTVTGTPYDNWIDSFPGVPASQSGFADDPNHDGVANGLAWYMLGGTPMGASQGVLPVASGGHGELTLVFICLKAAELGDASVAVQYSSDLGVSDPWHTATVPGSSATVNNVSFTITGYDATHDHVSALIPRSGAAGGVLYGRLHAEKP